VSQQVIAMRKHSGEILVNGIESRLPLPKGCTGILFCFESKKAAREYYGKDVELIEIKEIKEQ